MNKNAIMQGALEPGLLMDMLQVLNRRRNLSGYIEVKDEGLQGRIWLQEGVLIAANWKDRQGELAIESMLRLKQGFFEVCEDPILPARSIFKDTVAVLMVCMRAIGRDSLTPMRAPARIATVDRTTPALASVATIPAEPAVQSTPKPVMLATAILHMCISGGMKVLNGQLVAVLLVIGLAGAGIYVGGKAWENRVPIVPSKVETPAPAILLPVTTSVAPPANLANPPPVLQDVWPEVMLSALAASGTRSYCAILNGQLLSVGEQVDGVTVRSIRPNGVVLEYQGQHRFLYASRPR